MSVTSRIAGSIGKHHSFCAMYSLRMSVWIVPRSLSGGTPCRSAATTKNASITAAGALIVIDTETWSSGMPRKSRSMSTTESIATPSRPTSPSERGWSESWPIKLGMSNAVERPVCPCSSRYRKRSFVSSAVPKPANWRIVQRRPRYIDG
ncbi:hypothetical protein HRbin41_01353 [bacterium HR41]|nr:hypothetical protein HRbin41_01353 [bacterium HR41]